MIHAINPEYMSCTINRFGDYDFFIIPPKYGKNNPFLRCKAIDGTAIGIAGVKNFRNPESRKAIFELLKDNAIETFIGNHNIFHNVMRVHEPNHHVVVAAIPYEGVVTNVELSNVTNVSHIKSYRIHDKSVNEGKDKKILVMILRCDVNADFAKYTHSFRFASFETMKELKDKDGMIERERHYIDMFDGCAMSGESWSKVRVEYTHAHETPSYVATPTGRHRPEMVNFAKFAVTPHSCEE